MLHAMNDTLFDLPEQPSPRLAWMRKHGIITLHHAPGRGVPPTWFAGFAEWWPDKHGENFFAWETAHNGDSRIGEGDTEDEALAQLAYHWDMKLWNEETPL